MSDILELFVELLLDVAGYLLEVIGEIWLKDLSWPDTRGAHFLVQCTCAAGRCDMVGAALSQERRGLGH